MGVSSKIKFEDVARAALQQAHVLLPQWIGGKKVGREWHGETKANGGPGDSWKVNLDTGAWLHGAGDEKGKDLVSLYSQFYNVEQIVALERVAPLIGMSGDEVAPVLPHVKPTEKAAEPIPLDAPPIPAHFKMGEPSAVYKRYAPAFWVARWDTAEGKTFHPYTWRAGKWVAKAYPDPKPLYNAAELLERPADPVMVVEGEKCAEVMIALLKRNVTVTWFGGAQAVRKSDWRVLADRDVVIWPDADDAGKKAAATIAEILAPIAARVRVIQTNGQADGWDAADAVAAGWDAKTIADWATQHIKVIEAPPPDPPPRSVERTEPPDTRKGVVSAPVEAASSFVSWSSMGLDSNEGGVPHPTLANASLIIAMHPDLKGKIWYDSFTNKIVTTLHGTERPWRDSDDMDMTVFIQQRLRLPKFQLMLVANAVMHAARLAQRNSLTDWLDSLVWDQTPRLETWLSDSLGVEHNEYSQAIAVNWPISMVARAFVPGCKVDTMPVLEGHMGLSKTSFLEILGHPWYVAVPAAFGEKDFLQSIQGRWLIEVPDMANFSKRDHSLVLATLTIRRDVYRPAYGRHVLEQDRTAVFAATSENDSYLQEARGRRRFWPLRCTAIDLDCLRSQREQVFAEAVQRYRHGASWWQMPGSADAEQMDRAEPDLWTDKVMDYANYCWDEAKRTGTRIAVTSSRILQDAIDLPLSKQDDHTKRRIARIMRENGWIAKRDAYGRSWKKVERPQ